jgi:hypothetical protein
VSRSIRFDPAARLETIEAAVWYDDHRIGLGEEFLDASNSPSTSLSVAEFRARLLPTSTMFDVFQ